MLDMLLHRLLLSQVLHSYRASFDVLFKSCVFCTSISPSALMYRSFFFFTGSSAHLRLLRIFQRSFFFPFAYRENLVSLLSFFVFACIRSTSPRQAKPNQTYRLSYFFFFLSFGKYLASVFASFFFSFCLTILPIIYIYISH